MQAWFLHVIHLLLWSSVHILAVVVARCCGLAEHGQHPGIESFPITEIVLCHLVAVELVLVIAGVTLLRHIEIKHPAGICPNLVIAAIQAVGQHELPASHSLGTDYHTLALYENSVW